MTLKTLRVIMAHATESGKRLPVAEVGPELRVVQFRIWQAQSMALITQSAKAELIDRRN